MGVEDEAAPGGLLDAALAAVAPTLVCLSIAGGQWDAGSLRAVLPAGASSLPQLREVVLGCDRWPVLLGAEDAAALAVAAPELTSLRLEATLGRGVGDAWAARRGRLRRLSTIEARLPASGWESLRELTTILAARRLVVFRYAGWSGPALIRALLGCEAPPAALHLDRSYGMDEDDVVRLGADPRTASAINTLTLPALSRPDTLFPTLSSLIRLTAVELVFDVEGVDPSALLSSLWVVPPTLVRLCVQFGHSSSGAPPRSTSFLGQSSHLLVGKLVRSLIVSPCVATLHHLSLRAVVPPAALGTALAPLAAAAIVLRTLRLGVKPVEDDRVEQQRRLRDSLVAVRPGVTVVVEPFSG